MGTYIKSSNIKVFPAAGRADDFPEGFLTTEDNLSNFIRALYTRNNSGFVVSLNPLKFVIMGYVFEITDPSVLDLTGDLYATIYLRKDLETGSYERLIPADGTTGELDVTGDFIGVLFTQDTASILPAPEGSDPHTLQILNAGAIPEGALNVSEALSNCLDKIEFSTEEQENGTSLVFSTFKYPSE